MGSDLLNKYLIIKDVIIRDGYQEEISWQSTINFDNIDESYFLREIAWVILSSGMRETVINKIFDKISESFYFWNSAKTIFDNRNKCFSNSLKYFNNKPKINAIIEAADIIVKYGFNEFKKMILSNPIEKLQKFSYIGPVTAYHLAKNIGINVAKPDRHLMRIAQLEGYNDVQKFCSDISTLSGDSIPVVDIIFWRFATIEKNYLQILSII